MKLWRVWRDESGYDEYGAFVIRAETLEAAQLMAQGKGGDAIYNWHVVEVLVDGDPEIIVDSFNAG